MLQRPKDSSGLQKNVILKITRNKYILRQNTGGSERYVICGIYWYHFAVTDQRDRLHWNREGENKRRYPANNPCSGHSGLVGHDVVSTGI